ncbi:MAG: hypothetical protein ABSG49_10755 [Methanoregula sp.]|jgi:hypothetical protein|uniref:hypothetical protein n=1 Tax=Methanoregula sp. TaxID=2052170 RepID=UPI003C244397
MEQKQEQKQFLVFDQPAGRTTSYLIGDVVIPAPSFIPEIKGDEDIEVILKNSKLLPIGNPLMVPAFRWTKLIENPLFRDGDVFRGLQPALSFVKEHPIIFYDPPELFRYTLTKTLISYALKGDRGAARRFNNYLKKGNQQSAIGMVDPFFQPFIERQMPSILDEMDVKSDNSIDDEKSSHLEEAWLDSKINDAYFSYIFGIVTEAQKMPNATVIPPVPPLLKSSSRTFLSRIKMANRAASLACKMASDATESKEIFPYYHLYVDWNIIEPGQGNDVATVLQLVKDGVTSGRYGGVAVTIKGYEDAAKKRKITQLAMFMNDIVNIAHEYKLPVITPRSKWYGLYFTDYTTQGFSCLLSGTERYLRRGAPKNPEVKFGKTPIIEKCIEMYLEDLKAFIKQNGECPTIEGLPRRIPPELLTKDKDFRINWSKPMRLIHIEEARRMRETKLKGIWNPAKLYLERSEDPLLKSIT